jgi:NAD(P)-dependent dehydrogenase (short-subunit alcohol dehydrogenase family)
MILENKTIAVTGAASGIGAASAKVLKSYGATIIGFDRNEPQSNVDQFIKVDLTNPEQIKEAVAQCDAGIDALCNIAGVPPSVPPLVQMDVNFYGLRSFTELMIPKLNSGASIVNLASLAGHKFMEHIPEIKYAMTKNSGAEIEEYLKEKDLLGVSSYAFSKEVVIVWTMKMVSLLKEKNITIKALSPGPVKTPILQDFMDTIVKSQALPPVGFEGEPSDIAEAIAFLCGPHSRWINGRNLIIDGGLSSTRMSAALGL